MVITGNIGLGKGSGTDQSSTPKDTLTADNGVDGHLTGAGSCALTNGTGASSFPPSWWRLDLGSQHSVYSVTIYARQKDCCE